MTRFRVLAEGIRAQLPGQEVIVDVEIVALDDAGRIDFGCLMRGRAALAYAAFDLLWKEGRDLRPLSLLRRKHRLERLIPRARGPLSRVPTFDHDGRELLEATCRLNLEGVVAKRKTDRYQPETAWYKIWNPTYTQAEGRHELFERQPR